MAQSGCTRQSSYPKTIKVPHNIRELDTSRVPTNVDSFEYYQQMMQQHPHTFRSCNGSGPIQSLDAYHSISSESSERIRQPIEHSTIQSPERTNGTNTCNANAQANNYYNTRKISSESNQYLYNTPPDDTSFKSVEVGHSFDDDASSISNSMNELHLSESRSSFSEDTEDGLGLQHSLSGIQGPAPIRSNSNSSQGSCDSTLSFKTVSYDTGEFPRTPKNQIPTANTRPTSTQPFHDQPKLIGPSGMGGAIHRVSSTSSSGTSNDVRLINHNQRRQELNQNSPQIFISYAQEPAMPEFRRLVLQLAKTLLNNGISVSLDMLERNHMSMSFNEWLDDKLLHSTFVVVCISPNYKNEIIAPDQQRQHSIHTKYIFQRLQTEYIQNGSLNYRVIPVLLAGATQTDVPSLWQDTHAYQWPHEYEHIIYRIFRKEMYVKPKMGPAPICTVIGNGEEGQQYNDHHRSSVSSAGSAK